ncbi:MAG: YcfL family protein [Zoogloeaceae bacterium]|jgi:uncharacterized protein YcfL|nr:YcfL family protein [Zoogloeaceae bacterium]
MKKSFLAATFLGLCVLALPLQAQVTGDGSIASKVESLGEMANLKVSDLRVVARRDGLLRVQVTITNESSANEQLYYRFRWLDNDGLVVWEEEPWKPEVVYGLQSKILTGIAPTFQATDFRLEVQSPNNSVTSNPPPGSIIRQ